MWGFQAALELLARPPLQLDKHCSHPILSCCLRGAIVAGSGLSPAQKMEAERILPMLVGRSRQAFRARARAFRPRLPPATCA